jgi:hypothetical protein
VTDDGTHWLVPGQEDPRFFMGHALGLNLTAAVRDEDRYLDNAWVADEIHRQGGLYGHAHTMSYSASFNVERDLTLLCPEQKSDFSEILQCNILATEIWYDFLNLGFPLAASAGSDVPFQSGLGEVRVYAHAGAGAFTPDAWFDALMRGRTFVTNGPMLEFTVNGILPGGEIRARSTADTVRAEARAFGLPGHSAPVRLRIVRFGDILKEARAADTSTPLLECGAELAAGHGFWVAAEAEGADGSRAHTTPVYVTLPGFRFWDARRVPALLKKRHQSLDNTEGALSSLASRLGRGGMPPHAAFDIALARQAPPVLERVQRVRAIYRDLERQLRDEARLRNQEP